MQKTLRCVRMQGSWSEERLLPTHEASRTYCRCRRKQLLTLHRLLLSVMPAIVIRQRKPWRRRDGIFLYFVRVCIHSSNLLCANRALLCLHRRTTLVSS